MDATVKILAIIGPTASGKSSRAVAEAIARGGEVISVDSRQIYRTLDIGTEKITREEMHGIPHHLIDIREPEEAYSAGDFVEDASHFIDAMVGHEKVPILAGGTHFYFDALINGLPEETPQNLALRKELEAHSTEELYARVAARDARRAKELDPKNRRRIIRALEIIEAHGVVPTRSNLVPRFNIRYDVEWIVLDPPMEELKERINARLEDALSRGLVEEVRKTRERVGDTRLNELGLEYRVVGEYLRGKRTEESLLPALFSKLVQYARRQKAWIRKLESYTTH